MSDLSVRALLAEGARALSGEEARGEAEWLLRHVLGVERAWLYAHGEDALGETASADFRRLIARRAEGEPIAYLVGRREFWSLDLCVTRDVLIPRPETELLVEWTLEKMPGEIALDIADLGTGSGAIALALARERPHARVLATDISPAALGVARDNARRLSLRNVEFAQGEWGAALGTRRFDALVANPPYIALGDAHLQEGDLRFEPATALASGDDGLDAIRRIVRDAPAHLHSGGWLLIEHGYDQGEGVRAILTNAGFDEVATRRDLEHRDRATSGKWPAD